MLKAQGNIMKSKKEKKEQISGASII